jgi:O-acetylhomoserine (thiol)-lyase
MGEEHDEQREFGFHTRAVHSGQRPDPYTGASATPIYQTAGFVFEDTESASAYFNLQEYGNIYSRIMNPTVAAFEERIANLENGAGAVAFASGLAAQAALFFALLEAGDRIAVAKALYGGSTAQLNHLARKLQIEIDWVDMDDPDGWRKAVSPATKAFFAETIANPGGNVLDLETAVTVAREVGAPLIVDNTFATPYLCRPLEWGADIVVHSATKFIVGNGTTIAGVVVDSGEFDWSNGRFPNIAEPSSAYHGLRFHETFGVYGLLMKLRAETLRDLGAALAPFNAFLLLSGLETLPVRMVRHVDSALAVANWLLEQPGVAAVRHPALPDSPYRALVDKYLPLGAGSVFSFDLESGRDGGRRFIEALTLWSHIANVGDTKSLVIHPASTTHRQLSDEELVTAGVAPGTVRLSVGLEDVDDLVWDLERGLRAARETTVTA